jgi:alpha-methylacyl-CoA racemase
LLLQKFGLQGDPDFASQMDASRWPAAKTKLASLIRTRTRDEWCAILEGSDACFAPVLSLDEAPSHPHNRARGTFVVVDGVVQPAPAPRYGQKPLAPRAETSGRQALEGILRNAGISPREIEASNQSGALWWPPQGGTESE